MGDDSSIWLTGSGTVLRSALGSLWRTSWTLTSSVIYISAFRTASHCLGHPTTHRMGGCCLPLVLACLACQFSTLILGLLEACSSCLHTFCSSCFCCCSRCCATLQEDLRCHTHCHQILFESCCEPTECLEFCLECCELCHTS